MNKKQIQIDYYALIREERGISNESLETEAETLEELYGALREKYNFRLSTDKMRVAVNDRFCHWGTPVKQGDRVIFIPPVAGG